MENITDITVGMTGAQLIAALNDNYTAIGDNARGHGANIANFLKKAIDYKDSRFASSAPNVVIIGDSITNDMYDWTWSRTLKALLIAEYGIPEANVIIYCRGGYNMEHFIPWIEDALIHCNPDLVVFAEYEGWDTPQMQGILVEKTIQLVKQRTSSDVAIVTWGSSQLVTIYNSGTPLDWDVIKENGEFEQFNFYRNLASKYNCELLDINRALIDAVVAGTNPVTLYGGIPHMVEAGYAICNTEIEKHFKDTSWQARYSYPNANTPEELILLASVLQMESFYNIHPRVSFLDHSNWSYNHTLQQLLCSTNSEELIIDFEGIGIELFYAQSDADHDIKLSIDGGSNWINPSAHVVAGRPLQYATPVESVTYTNPDQWVLQVPIFHVEVVANILADTVRISRQYRIIVTAIDPNVVCAVYDPDDSLLGSFTVGTDETIGNLKFNAQWNGVNNYLLAQTPDVNDEFGFYIKSNWQDTINTNTGASVRIQGLTNGSYKVKFVKKDTTESKFKFIKILKPSLA